MSELHDVSHFACAHKSLESFLKRFALKNARNHLGRTYVLTQPGDNAVLGYYTLAAYGISRDSIPDHEALPRYDILPALLLGRLAVREDRMGQGLGRLLIAHVFEQAWMTAHRIGAYLLAVDAKDAEAKRFYIHFDFNELNDDPLHLFIPMKTIGLFTRQFPPPNGRNN
jgi:GNAT superfamily N-acetyltransferase